jgi:hypothetical protein
MFLQKEKTLFIRKIVLLSCFIITKNQEKIIHKNNDTTGLARE